MADALLAERLKIAKTQLLLANIRTNAVAALVASTIVFLMLMQRPHEALLIPWYVAILTLSLIRLFHVQRCRKSGLTTHNVDSTICILGLLSFMSGCAWGSLGLAYISQEDPTPGLILLMVYTGLVANASLTMSSMLRIYLLFVLPILVPTVYKFWSLGEAQYLWIALLIVVYMSVSFITTGRLRALLQRTNLLRLENNDLIESLQVQNRKTETALTHAEQANRAKSRFFAAASHDLRQPLQSISMFTTTLATHTETESQKTIVSQIDKSVRSLEGLFNALLDISALDAGTIKLRKQHFYLKPYIDELSLEFVEWCAEKNLQFKVDVTNDIVHTDPMLLSRIVRNLVENAVRYTNSGSVTLSSSRKAEHVVLSVSDTGIGIPDDNVDRIFEEFVQLNNPGRDRIKGLGLGLSIVQRICQLSDMTLKVESLEGSGSTFSVGMDYGKASGIELLEEDCVNVNPSLHGMFVLIIDDEEEIRDSMEGLLSVWGCTVMVASHGAEAVQQIKEFGICPQAIITDYRLQDNETGAHALEAIQKHCQQDIPAIIITGDIAQDRLVEIDKLGWPVLHKPCSASVLLARLQDVKRCHATDHMGTAL